MRFGTITDSMEKSLSKLREIVKNREAWHATQFMELQRVTHCLVTEQQHHCVCCLSFLSLTDFSSKVPNRKYFGLWRLYNLLQQLNFTILAPKAGIDNM